MVLHSVKKTGTAIQPRSSAAESTSAHHCRVRSTQPVSSSSRHQAAKLSPLPTLSSHGIQCSISERRGKRVRALCRSSTCSKAGDLVHDNVPSTVVQIAPECSNLGGRLCCGQVLHRSVVDDFSLVREQCHLAEEEVPSTSVGACQIHQIIRFGHNLASRGKAVLSDARARSGSQHVLRHKCPRVCQDQGLCLPLFAAIALSRIE
mmetsp:Transcript_11797/g.38825  ORF Transcript_11797/g.38825 Transcript_11797/m.38825 type:complete len:205 (-) Transcript_11797:1042-1656(-)